MPISTPDTTAARLIHGTNVDDAVAFYERVYDSGDIHIGEPADHGFRFRHRSVGNDDVTLSTSFVDARRWGTIEPGRDYILAWASDPGITLDTGSRSPVVMEPGVPLMYPAGRPFEFDALPSTQHLVRFDGRFLESLVAAQHGRIPGPLVFAPRPAPDATAGLRRAIADAAPELMSPATDPSRRGVLNLAIAEVVATAFAVEPEHGTAASAGPSSMRAAQEWMVANAREPLTVGRIAEAAGVEPRALQQSFSRHLGVTPLGFLREIRLHRAHAALLAADQDDTSVSAIASEWGFGHMGRFSSAYRRMFAEYPSETLRRR